MALYRCAACGSPNVVTDTQAGGVSYNYKKGIVGTVVLGVGGAAAGIESKTQRVYKCPDCGLTMSHPMDNELKMAIDMGVVSAEARSNLKYQGIALPWEMLVRHYKNIESGYGDEQVKRASELAEKKAKDEAEYLKQLSALILENMKQPKMEHDVAAEQKVWELLNAEKFEAMTAEIKAAEDAIKASAKEARANLEKQLAGEMTALSARMDSLTAEKNSLDAQLAKLGFFSFGAKKEIQAKIEQVSKELQAAVEEAKQYTRDENTRKLNRAEAVELEKISEITEEIRSKYNIPESPADIAKRGENWERIKAQFKKDAEGTGSEAYAGKVKAMMMTLAEFGEPLTKEQFTYLLNACFGEEVSEQRVSVYARGMCPEVFIRNYDDNTFSANK